MAGKKKDSVPKELVGRHIAEFCSRFPDKPVSGDRFLSATDILAERVGCDPEWIRKIANGIAQYDVSFDMADRIFCAMGSPNLWHCDPELKDVYGRVVVEADRLAPVAEPEPPEPIVCVCEQCAGTFEVFRQHGSLRRFCSQACRQAAYKERKVAA